MNKKIKIALMFCFCSLLTACSNNGGGGSYGNAINHTAENIINNTIYQIGNRLNNEISNAIWNFNRN